MPWFTVRVCSRSHFWGIIYNADGAEMQLDAVAREVQTIATRYDGTLV